MFVGPDDRVLDDADIDRALLVQAGQVGAVGQGFHQRQAEGVRHAPQQLGPGGGGFLPQRQRRETSVGQQHARLQVVQQPVREGALAGGERPEGRPDHGVGAACRNLRKIFRHAGTAGLATMIG